MSASPAETLPPGRDGVAMPLARSVADDLEAILPPAQSAPPARSRLRLGAGGSPSPRAPERRAGRLGALLAVALLGVSAGALLAHLPARSPPPPRPPLALPQPEAFAPALALRPAIAAAPPPARVAPVQAPPARRPAVQAPASRAHAAPQVCGAHRRCGRVDVMAADRRLRSAYAAAVRAGVARPVLASYRTRWARLRPRAPTDPARVVVGYRGMASDLERLARRPAARWPRHHLASHRP